MPHRCARAQATPSTPGWFFACVARAARENDNDARAARGYVIRYVARLKSLLYYRDEDDESRRVGLVFACLVWIMGERARKPAFVVCGKVACEELVYVRAIGFG